MSKMKVEVIPCSATPLIYDEEKCIGCNACAEICQCDIILPNPEKGKPPIVMFPGECYYCGACVMVCPKRQSNPERIRENQKKTRNQILTESNRSDSGQYLEEKTWKQIQRKR